MYASKLWPLALFHACTINLHRVSWSRHNEDLQAALDWVAEGGLGEGAVDVDRIGLWGISYSGGSWVSCINISHESFVQHEFLTALIKRQWTTRMLGLSGALMTTC